MYYIHKEGRMILLALGFCLILVNCLLYFFSPDLVSLRTWIGVISGIIYIAVLSFFRIPKARYFVEDDKMIVAPADGKIVAIEEVEEPEYFKDKRIQVSIFMSPANVHVNLAPIRGKVKYTKYHPGNYLVAWHPKSSEKNERYTTVIENEDTEFEVLVRQIAGKVARKITNYLDEGEEILQGKELGFIKFGSRVDIFLPINTKINVDLKQKVQGGKTILAELA